MMMSEMDTAIAIGTGKKGLLLETIFFYLFVYRNIVRTVLFLTIRQ